MPPGLRETLTEAEVQRLELAMDWVIPADSSLGAGSAAGISQLLDLVDSLESPVAAAYQANLSNLQLTDLADPSNTFATMFVEHVRDVYYGSPDTGAWEDIGFEVTSS